MKSISQKIMKGSDLAEINGVLELSLNGDKISLKCEGQLMQLTFASLLSLTKFFKAIRPLESLVGKEIQLQDFHISYYINDLLVAQSSPHLAKSLMGRYFGQDHLHIYFIRLFQALWRKLSL